MSYLDDIEKCAKQSVRYWVKEVDNAKLCGDTARLREAQIKADYWAKQLGNVLAVKHEL